MRHETKQLIKNISIGLGVFALIGLVLYGVWHGTRANAVTISEVTVLGGETISHDAIKVAVTGLLQGEYMGFIPRSFTWLYPETEIMEALTATPRVKDPVIERDGKQLIVTLAEFEPVALWCDDTTAANCVFLDSNGYGFAAAPDLSGGAYTRYVQVGQAASTSAVFTDVGDFALLQELVVGLEQVGWPAVAIEYDQARDAFVQLSGGGELKVSLTQSPADTIANLQTIRAAEQYADLAPGNFVYIDLRFGNKIFVSEQGAPTESVETESAGESEDVTEIENATSSEVATE